MPAGRIALVTAGLLLGAGALLLIMRGFHAVEAEPAPGVAAADPAAAGAAGPGAAAAGRGKAGEAPPPRWQSFLRPDERETPRPVVRLARGLPSPFDRLAGLAGGGARPESPGFRLEGIAAGAHAVALISGHAVREGGTISGYRVVRIGRSAVTLAGPRGARLDLALEVPRQLSAPPRSGGGRRGGR
jgi:hypothetical protein